MSIWEIITTLDERIDVTYIAYEGFTYMVHIAIFLFFARYLADEFEIDIFEHIRQLWRRIFRKKRRR